MGILTTWPHLQSAAILLAVYQRHFSMLVRCLTSFLFFCTICACDDSAVTEDEVREIYENAIKEWDNGNVESAISAFSLIERDYLSTVTATEALKERKRRTDEYLLDHSHMANQQRNPHFFARNVLLAIDKKITETGSPPADLVEIAQPRAQPHMGSAQDCTYSVSQLNSAYRLDCSGVKEFHSAESSPETVYSRRYTQGSTAPSLADFEKASPTVGTKLKGKKGAPRGHLSWSFYDTEFPTRAVASGTDRVIALAKHQNAAQNIEPSNLGAFWEGFISSSLYRETRSFTIDQGAENARIILDGRSIYDGGEAATTKHVQLDPGRYRLKVEYIGAGSNVDFELQMTSEELTIETPLIRQRMAKEGLADHNVYHVAVYNAPSRILTLNVDLKKSDGPVVLVLSSYEAIDWVINNLHGAEIRAIVYGASEYGQSGSSLAGDITDVAIQIHSAGSIGGYRSKQKCGCNAGYYHCNVNDVGDKVTAIADISNGTLRGYTEEYSASALTLPRVILNDEDRFEAETRLLRRAEAKFQCEQEYDPDFENMISFDEAS